MVYEAIIPKAKNSLVTETVLKTKYKQSLKALN